MYPCYMYSNTWFGFKFYHMMICSYEPAFNSDIKVYDTVTEVSKTVKRQSLISTILIIICSILWTAFIYLWN